MDVRAVGELANGAGGEPFVELDGINFPEAIFLDADHVAEIGSGFDQNLELVVLGKFGEGALLDQMRNLGARFAADTPPGVLAHKRGALVNIEQAGAAQSFLRNFAIAGGHARSRSQNSETQSYNFGDGSAK